MNSIGKIALLTALALGLGTAASIPVAHASTRVSISLGVAPGLRAAFVWAPGYWRHDRVRTVWVPGRWVGRENRYAYDRVDRRVDRRIDRRVDRRDDRRVDRREDRRDDRREDRRSDRRGDRREDRRHQR